MSAPSPAAARPTSLPTILTPVLGRTRELDGVMTLLDNPAQRLVTLTGPGGVGKTRLALHIASTLVDEFERDVVFIPLAAIRDPDLLLPTISGALDAPTPVDPNAGLEERVIDALEARSPLLVLDNFEQLLGAAPIIANLLARSPHVTLLITSQAALGITGEQLYPLAPLPTPTTDQTTAASILDSEAVALFVARARAVKPSLVLDDRTAVTIAEICRRLDGLPLAIELAAARSTILSPEALLARLSNRLQVLGGEQRGVPDRLRTMRHAIAWSYDLLTPPEQDLFRHLAVFAGGIALEAVEAMFRPADGERDAFGVLSALVDHSLVRVAPHPAGDPRFLILETLREYGLEQLEVRGEVDATRFAHAEWVLTLAETAEPHLIGGNQKEWLDRLDSEWENIRAALDWALESGNPEIAVRILSAIWRFCSARGHVTESRGFLDRALDATRDDDSPNRARALTGAGYLAEDQRDLDIAHARFTESQELAARTGEGLVETQALIGLGTVAHDRGEYTTAYTCHAQAAEVARRINDQRAIGIAVGNMGNVSYLQGDYVRAAECWEESRSIMHRLGDQMAEAISCCNLGAIAIDGQDFSRAQMLLTRALDLQRQLMSVRDIPFTLINLGEAWLALGDYTLSADCFCEAIALLRDFNAPGIEGVALNGYAHLAFVQGDHPAAAARIIESVRLMSSAGDQLSITENAELLAEMCLSRGNYAPAVELFASAAALRKALEAAPTSNKHAKVDAFLATARTAIGERRFAENWTTGSGQDFEALTLRIGIVAREIIGTRQPSPEYTPPAPEPVAHNLTNREVEVLRMLAQGQSTQDISAALYISPRTTSTHIANILGKLEVTSRTAAVAWAMRTGLV